MEVLSQDEIDQLLTAINAGDTEPDDFRYTRDTRKIKIYDFKRPDKFSKEQIRTISIIHETFARSVTTMLSSYFRTMVHVHVASVDQLTYEEFIRSIPTPTMLLDVKMFPLPGNAVLEIDPAITKAMLHRLFGGEDIPNSRQHELTDLEKLAIQDVAYDIVTNLDGAWKYIIPLTTRVERIETNPLFIQTTPPTEMVVLVTLETKIGDTEGMMNICFPYPVLESIMPKLSAAFWYGNTDRNIKSARTIDVNNIPVLMRAELFSRVCTMAEILKWKKKTVFYPHNKTNLQKCVIKLGDYIVFSARIVEESKIFSSKIRIERLLEPYKERFMENRSGQLGEFDTSDLGSALKDVNIQVSVELGRTRHTINEILSMGEGTIIELDKLAGEPVDILANNVPIAKGEVVVIDENFGVRVTDIFNIQRPKIMDEEEFDARRVSRF